jgi:hypothetical protein
VSVEVTVFELDRGSFGAFDDETHLHLARPIGVGLYLPGRADIPADDYSVGRLIGEDPGLSALAAVYASVVEVAAHSGLEHRLGDLSAEQVVLGRLEPAEVHREHPERPLDRRVHDHRVTYRRRYGFLAHHVSS